MDTHTQEQEHFTFPTTTTTTPPPLWRRTTSLHKQIKNNKPINQGGGDIFSKSKPPIKICNNINNYSQRKSFSYFEDYCSEDEKMDMLWEDLNGEYSKNRGLLPVPDSGESPARMVRFGCVKADLVVFGKVLKKLFVLPNSHHSLIKKSW